MEWFIIACLWMLGCAVVVAFTHVTAKAARNDDAIDSVFAAASPMPAWLKEELARQNKRTQT